MGKIENHDKAKSVTISLCYFGGWCIRKSGDTLDRVSYLNVSTHAICCETCGNERSYKLDAILFQDCTSTYRPRSVSWRVGCRWFNAFTSESVVELLSLIMLLIELIIQYDTTNYLVPIFGTISFLSHSYLGHNQLCSTRERKSEESCGLSEMTYKGGRGSRLDLEPFIWARLWWLEGEPVNSDVSESHKFRQDVLTCLNTCGFQIWNVQV